MYAGGLGVGNGVQQDEGAEGAPVEGGGWRAHRWRRRDRGDGLSGVP